MHVFRLENRSEQKEIEYAGGSNKSAVEDINNMTTKSMKQSHDYVSFTKDWLDWLKCAVFLGFFWIVKLSPLIEYSTDSQNEMFQTLATMFLAGTNRINVFSVGYLAGSYIFLWQVL